MRVDELIGDSGKKFKSKFSTLTRIFGSIAVASACGGSVIIMVAVSKLYGIISLLIATLIFIGIPVAYLIVIKTKNKSSTISIKDNHQPIHSDSLIVSWVEKTVTVTTSYKPIVLATTVVITCLLYTSDAADE